MSALLLAPLAGMLLVLRQPLMLVLMALAAAVHLIWGRGHPEWLLEDMWNALDKELILSIPLFLLCGQVMSRGATAQRLVRVMRALVGWMPGGLAVACVLACAVDASISGSSIATMLAIGSVMAPALVSNGYERRFSYGCVMAGGTLGIIIPPSIPMILYGLVTETSVVDLFAAGVGPGLLLAGVFALYAAWKNRRLPVQPFDAAELRAALREGVWALLMPVILLGGIWSGFFSIVESAAVAFAYAVAIELFVHRALSASRLRGLVLEAARIAGGLLPVLAVAISLVLILNEHRVPATLVGAVQPWIDSPLAFILVVNLLLLAVGCLMTIDAAILVLAPLLAPMAEAYGFDRVLFGVLMILNLEIGFLTPPVGLNLIVAAGAFRQPFAMLCRAAAPFVVLMLGCLTLVTWQPWIALALVR
jgi:C4-dicarboxylate transporter DctM subunit